MVSIHTKDNEIAMSDDKNPKKPVVEFNDLSDLESDSASARRPGSIWTITGCVQLPSHLT
jgi:hypothetical protein